MGPPASAGRAAEAASPRRGGPEGFESVWNAYGDPRPEEHDAALEVWPRYTRGVPLDDVLAGAERWARAYAESGCELRWRKRPVNWLKEKCWEKDPPTALFKPKREAKAKKAKAKRAKKANGKAPAEAGLSARKVRNAREDAWYAEYLRISRSEDWDILTAEQKRQRMNEAADLAEKELRQRFGEGAP